MHRSAAWTLGLLLVGACASAPRQPAAARTPDVVGVYVVEQVNGAPLPARLRAYPQGHTELVSGGLDLRPDGTFVETGAVRLAVGPVANTQTHTAAGRYTVAGPRVVMTYSQGGRSVTATAEGKRLTVTTESLTITYARQ